VDQLCGQVDDWVEAVVELVDPGQGLGHLRA
jgi:hypothetical protein